MRVSLSMEIVLIVGLFCKAAQQLPLAYDGDTMLLDEFDKLMDDTQKNLHSDLQKICRLPAKHWFRESYH